jgi:hypothetical protein
VHFYQFPSPVFKVWSAAGPRQDDLGLRSNPKIHTLCHVVRLYDSKSDRDFSMLHSMKTATPPDFLEGTGESFAISQEGFTF